MSDQTNNDKILIVGAGIGGLALAQGLRKHNIPYEIFERDTDQRSRKQGWAIAIVEALERLPEYLADDMGDMHQTSVNAGLDEPDSLALLDFQTGDVSAILRGNPQSKSQDLLRAGREHFRNYLWNHIPVSTGKHFSHYTTDSSGVTVHFKDGSSSTGAILVGADGASSHVRTQLLGPGPSSAAELSSFIPMIGEVTLTREQYLPLASAANSGFVSGDTNTRYVVGRRSIAPDGSTADYFFVVCWHSKDPVRDSAWAQTATQEELFDKCMERIHHLPSNVTDIVSLTGPSGMVTPPIRLLEFVPPSTMPHGRVTLLGDAAHAMTPFKGAGANTALEDACDLAGMIVKRSRQKASGQPVQDWEDVILEYSNTMTKRGAEKVRGSRQAGTEPSSAAVLEGRQHLLVDHGATRTAPAANDDPIKVPVTLVGPSTVVAH